MSKWPLSISRSVGERSRSSLFSISWGRGHKCFTNIYIFLSPDPLNKVSMERQTRLESSKSSLANSGLYCCCLMCRHRFRFIVRASGFVFFLVTPGLVLSFVFVGRPYNHRQNKYRLLIGCNVDKLKKNQEPQRLLWALSRLFAHFNIIELFHEAKIIFLAIPTTII